MSDTKKENILEGEPRYEVVHDVGDPKWSIPSAKEVWNLAMGNESTVKMYDLSYSIEEKRVWAEEQYKDMAATEPVFDENSSCELTVYDVPGCPEEPDTGTKAYVVLPKSLKNKKKQRVLFLIPGGAMMLCSPVNHARPITEYAEKFECMVVSPLYRTSLDAPYPAAVNDIHAVYQWLMNNAKELGVNTNKIVLSGVSSGAGLAAALPFRLMRYGYWNVRGVVADNPITDDREMYPSSELHNVCWDGKDAHVAYRMWLGYNHGSARVSPEALANHAKVEDCIGYPPLFIHSNEFDPDSDYSRDFFGKVKAAHSFAEFHGWGGVGHVGFILSPELAVTKNMVIDQNIRILFEEDLRRPWVIDEYKEKIAKKFEKM